MKKILSILTKTLFTIGKFEIKVWYLIVVFIVFGTINGQLGLRSTDDLVDLTGEYSFEKSETILGELTWMKSKLTMEKDGENYKYSIDEILGVGRKVESKNHYGGIMDNELSIPQEGLGGMKIYEWRLLGDKSLVEKGSKFELTKRHFGESELNQKNDDTPFFLHLCFDEGKGYQQDFKRIRIQK